MLLYTSIDIMIITLVMQKGMYGVCIIVNQLTPIDAKYGGRSNPMDAKKASWIPHLTLVSHDGYQLGP